MFETSPLFRQWSLLRLIAADGGATIKSLRDASNVSDKTIRRDVELLRTAGFPIRESVGKYGRHSFSMDADAPALRFNFDEALALHLCRRATLAFGGTYIDQSLATAFAKLKLSIGDRVAKYVDTMLPRIAQTQAGSDYSSKAEMLDRLLIAVEEDRAVFVTYQSQRSTEPVTYDVYPYRIIEHRGSLYLFGHSPDHGETRTWKIDRMLDADPTEIRFQRPDDAEISAQLAGSFGIYAGKGDIVVRIRFAPSTARYVAEKRMHPANGSNDKSTGARSPNFGFRTRRKSRPGFSVSAQRPKSWNRIRYARKSATRRKQSRGRTLRITFKDDNRQAVL